MAPKRKSPATAAAVAAPAMASRITRSMAARKQAADAPAKKEEPAAVPSAPAGLKGKKKANKEDAALVEEEDVRALLSPPAAAKQKGKKNAKKGVVAAAAAPTMEAGEEDDGAVVEDAKPVVVVVVVEACTQCQQFKQRASKVKKELESAVPGVSVVINPEKPRRGCLEIREEGGEVFISLQDMSRPFKAMRDLDMDKVIQDIIKKIFEADMALM